jgi:hypothetical protein
LHRRHAEVEERAVDLGGAELVEGVGKVTKITAHERDAFGKIGRDRGRRIHVEGDDAAAARDDRTRVTRRPERPVEVEAVRPDRERVDRLDE